MSRKNGTRRNGSRQTGIPCGQYTEWKSGRVGALIMQIASSGHKLNAKAIYHKHHIADYFNVDILPNWCKFRCHSKIRTSQLSTH